jgi:NADH-quinone oxidoreductase subunit F
MSPTQINNVQTIATVPKIIELEADEFARIGPENSPGTAIFSLSGNVVRPGNYELELGSTLRELIYDIGGGIADGRELKAIIPGGSSVPVLTPDQLDTPMDYDSIGAAGSFFGSAAVMVIDDRCCMVQLALRAEKFYAHESCGKCTPCREGSGWLEKILYRMAHGYGRPDDLDLLLGFGNNLAPGLSWPPGMTTICQLGPSTMSPVVSLRNYWYDEIKERLAADAQRRGAIEVVAAP